MLQTDLLPVAAPERMGQPGWLDAGFTAGWLPAFRHRGTGEVHASHLEDGRLACTHILDTLPAGWIADRDAEGRPGALVADIQAGYLRGSRFYTLAELLRYPSDA
ncbi:MULTISPECIES: hypothetical protein [unclassified Thioalkalivibrio]|uniref:hypothetical protein n=1 Tax=unclassified Thioalkalivibrio TaxID=2621013 RepID=UPI00036A4D53|nr:MULTISPECIES: hypothetical protein [unclassified Thioalkalivibrio]